MTATPIPRDETCTVPGCELPPQFSRGYCTMHRQRLRFGRPMCPERLCAPHWTQAELDVLHENLGRLGFDGVARRLGRTRTAVLLKSRRLGLRIQGVDGRYTPNALGKLLGGECPKRIVGAWKDHGLRVSRTKVKVGPRSRGGRFWLIDPDDLRLFLRRRPEAYDWTRLSPHQARMLGLADMPERPACKVVTCTHCRRAVTVPLDTTGDDVPDGFCPFCGCRLPKWADGYSDGPPTPRRVPKPKLHEVAYYDRRLDRVRCLDCGRMLMAVNIWHLHTHGYASAGEYRAAHGLHPEAPLLCREAKYNQGHNWGKNTRKRASS